MRPILIVYNVNNADIMPHVVACAANPNDVHMTCIHWQVRHNYVIIMHQQLLIGLASSMLTDDYKINCLTIFGTTY